MMSETEHKRGKLNPTGKTLEQFLEGVEIPDIYDSKKEFFDDEFYRKAYLISGIVFEVDEEELDQDEDIFTSSHGNSGEIHFEIKFYNGGCSHSEAMDEALKEIGLTIA